MNQSIIRSSIVNDLSDSGRQSGQTSSFHGSKNSRSGQTNKTKKFRRSLMITPSEFFMGREKEYPLTLPLALNAAKTLAGINYLRGRYGKPLSCSSGYRPGRFNKAANGASSSSHLTCEAIDCQDKEPNVWRMFEGESHLITHFANWCLDNLDELRKAGLFLEDPRWTKSWTHLQTRTPRSLSRVFKP